jgi:hypothetical protein
MCKALGILRTREKRKTERGIEQASLSFLIVKTIILRRDQRHSINSTERVDFHRVDQSKLCPTN